MSKDHFIAAAFLLVVTSITLQWREPSPPSDWRQILADLRHECDPANPDADYSTVQSVMPTERKRAAILERCLEVGPDLLPWIKAAREAETDDELRGMLTVIAASLGDVPSRLPTAKAMIGEFFPALKISAAHVLRPIQDPALVPWFRTAMEDWHLITSSGCGIQGEVYFPVRTIAALALNERNLPAETHDENRNRLQREVLQKQ